MENTIKLQRTSDCWIAIYSGPHAEKIIDLFGTDRLPTAFVGRATAAVVQREIERLNPDCNVMIQFPL